MLIFCASYNGAAPDNATQFIKWLGGDLPKDAFAKVRYAVFGCGNSDWAATYQSIPRIIDEQLAAHGAQQRLCARRGRCPQRPRRPVRKLVRQGGPAGDEGIRRRFEFQPQRRRRAAVPDRAGGAVGGQCDRGARRRRADEGAGQYRTAEQDRRQCFRPIDPAYRGAVACRHQLPGRRPSQRGAAQRPVAGGCGRPPLRILAGRPDPPAGRGRPPRAIAGRRHGVGRAAALRIRRAAAGRDPQADPDHVGAHALSDDQAETAGLSRRRCRRHRTLPRGDPDKTQIGVRPAGGASGLRIAVPRLSRNAVAAGAALLFDLVVAVGRSLALQRHRRRGGGPRGLGARRLQGHLFELPRQPPRRRDHPRHGARDQGRLPAARRRRRAHHHDRAGNGSGAVPRLPRRSARPARPRAPASARPCCSSAAAIPIRIFSMRTS